jgi:CRISPR/Cas system CSM-associated protein Csm3 (group 7 of RAMP superfamily)
MTMPQGENFWNPYRWVPARPANVAYETPQYRHNWVGTSGRLECTLEALTPFLIGSSRGDGKFIRSAQTNEPYIPGTSLKGLIRSLAELVGNATIPFPNVTVDERHNLSRAAVGNGQNWRLDVAARMFGYLNHGRVFAGLVRFSDGKLQGAATEIGPFSVVGGQPKATHESFYVDTSRRKFYHHHPGANGLVEGMAHPRSVYPLQPGVRFCFRVDFENLREEELALLLYCLVLEEEVIVRLSTEALGPNAQEERTLIGPMRHKFGGCKPQGGGSVRIQIDRMQLRDQIADRYRGQATDPQVREGVALQQELRRQIQRFANCVDDTMLHLRAMLIYSENDPRGPISYPDYNWFNQDRNAQPRTGLKPTL